MARKLGNLLAKGLGIPIDDPERSVPDDLVQRGAEAISPFEPFIEALPTVKEWALERIPKRQDASSYLLSLFPFTRWIFRYNRGWFMADLIAGLTLSLLVIPQGLSYAILAGLNPEQGLYTSFSGAAFYWLFGTSKDISVGATAVISLLVGQTITDVIEKHPNFKREDIAKTHASLAGCIFLILGLLRLGWIIELIPHVAISAFVTAAALTIALGQIPAQLGIDGINTRGPAYQVFIDTCKGLGRTKLDAVIGLTSLALLMFMKWFCERTAVRYPRCERFWNGMSSFRLSFTIILFTIVSYLVNRDLPLEKSRFRILGDIHPGFNQLGPPLLQLESVTSLLPKLPATAIVIIIEHIAIGRSLGQKNDYSVSPSQELISIGVINMAGPFLGAYASTASFGGSALLSKARARTPLAGMFNGLFLILALYVLHKGLYWIPKASMASLIIHAVINLITPPEKLFELWLISPPDAVVYIVGLLISLFSTLEYGIYVTTGLSAGILLTRLARTPGQFLGRVGIRQYPMPKKEESDMDGSSSSVTPVQQTCLNMPSRDAYLPLDRKDASNQSIYVESPLPGIFVYRFPDGLNYANQSQHIDSLLACVMKKTRRTTAIQHQDPGDRLWNETPTSGTSESFGPDVSAPNLRAVILDFSTVSSIDTGAIEGLTVLRKQLEKWASPEIPKWHFACVNDRWVRRALVAAGFGYASRKELEISNNWNPVFTLAEKKGTHGSSGIELEELPPIPTRTSAAIEDAENGNAGIEGTPPGPRKLAATHGINYPNFHIDLTAAIGAVGGFPTPDGRSLGR